MTALPPPPGAVRLDDGTRVYVAGCGGMLGAAVYEQFAAQCEVLATDIDLNEDWLSYADVTDFDAFRRSVLGFRPQLLVNLAAMTDLEECERHPERAWATNAMGAENAGLVAMELGVPYVYVSSAGIFSGDKEWFTDYDEPRPLGVYARSKAYGEAWTRQTVRRHYVLRAGWMMGGGPAKDKKFLNKLFVQLRAGATELRVVGDKLGCPTYTVDFARGMRHLVATGRYGTYNQVCGGFASRYDVAVAFVEALGLADQVRVVEVSSAEFAADFFAPRPASEQLVNLKLDAAGLNVMRPWRECLDEYAKSFLE